jgi:hypothetical protein
VAALRRRIADQVAAARDVQLKLDEVEPGRRLGHRVLDLQPGVDLEEGEQLLARLVKELHGAGALVAGGVHERGGGGAQPGVLLGAQRRRAGLLDQLLVAALQRAVPDPGCPHRPVPVGDDLNLDVPPALDEALEEDDGVTEGALRLGLGARECVVELVRRAHDADAPAATAAAGLDDQGVADGAGLPDGLLDVVDRAAAPGGDGHARLLREQLALDLVAEPAHGLGRWPDEHHAQARAELGEGGVLGDEPPAHPGSIGAGDRERPAELVVVEVGAARPGAAQQDRLVSRPHERGPGLGLGMQRDDRGAGTVLGVELPHRADQPHRGLAPVHHRDALEHGRPPGDPTDPVSGPAVPLHLEPFAVPRARPLLRSSSRVPPLRFDEGLARAQLAAAGRIATRRTPVVARRAYASPWPSGRRGWPGHRSASAGSRRRAAAAPRPGPHLSCCAE